MILPYIRAAMAVSLGAVALVAIGRWIGWWLVAAIVVLAVADFVWCVMQLPTRWRPW